MKILILLFMNLMLSLSGIARSPFVENMMKAHLLSSYKTLEFRASNLDMYRKCLHFLNGNTNIFTDSDKELFVHINSLRESNFGEQISINCNEAITEALIPLIKSSMKEMRIMMALAYGSFNPMTTRNGGIFLDNLNHLSVRSKNLKHEDFLGSMFDGVGDFGIVEDLTEEEILKAQEEIKLYRKDYCIKWIESFDGGGLSDNWHRKVNEVLGRSSNLSNKVICEEIILKSQISSNSPLSSLMANAYSNPWEYFPVSDLRRMAIDHFRGPGARIMERHFKTQYLLLVNEYSFIALIQGDSPELDELISAFDFLEENSLKILNKQNEEIQDTFPEFEVSERWLDLFVEDLNYHQNIELLSERAKRLKENADRNWEKEIVRKFREDFKWLSTRERSNNGVIRKLPEMIDPDLKEKILTKLDLFWTNIDSILVEINREEKAFLFIGIGLSVGSCVAISFVSSGTMSWVCGIIVGVFWDVAFIVHDFKKKQEALDSFFAGVSADSRRFSSLDINERTSRYRRSLALGVILTGVFWRLGKPSAGAINN